MPLRCRHAQAGPAGAAGGRSAPQPCDRPFSVSSPKAVSSWGSCSMAAFACTANNNCSLLGLAARIRSAALRIAARILVCVSASCGCCLHQPLNECHQFLGTALGNGDGIRLLAGRLVHSPDHRRRQQNQEHHRHCRTLPRSRHASTLYPGCIWTRPGCAPKSNVPILTYSLFPLNALAGGGNSTVNCPMPATESPRMGFRR